MLSDEEKKAIERAKFLINIDTYLEKEMLINLLNLIEKQSKEIEHQIEKRANQRNELAILNAKQIEFNKLVNTVNSYKGQFKNQQKEIEELKNITKSYDSFLGDEKIVIADKKFFVNGYFQENFISKDKIKAKIKELEKLNEEATGIGYGFAIYYLQSLLEKE